MPDWPQWIGIGAVLLLGYLGNELRRRNGGSRRSRGRGADRGGERAELRPRPGRSGAGDSSVGSPHSPTSPGRSGEAATRDLMPAEIRALRPSYAPEPDGEPDPGEIVWTWVPYAEHDGRGKDRPVLIIARIDAGSFAGCYLSTKEHRGFVSIGSGGWDPQGRESFLSPERVLRVQAQGMRREGQVLPRDRFEVAIRAVVAEHRIGR